MASWFLKGLIIDRETRTTLYEVIDVNPKATEDEIRSAYKRRAVQLHPDKVRQRGGGDTSTAVAEFQRLKEAYDILSNKDRRKIYDEYGEGGLALIEDPSAIANSAEILFRNFVTMRNRDRMKLCLLVIIFMGSLLVAPILYCTQIDGHINAKWTALAIPLWFYDTVILFFLHLSVLAGKTPEPEPKEDNWTDPSPLKWRIHALLCLYFIFVFQMMVTLRMDEFITILWGYIFFFWYAFEALLWIQIIPRMSQKIPPMPSPSNEEGGTTDGNEEHKYLESLSARIAAHADKLKAVTTFIWSLYRIHQLLMIGFKLDGIRERHWNWWAVFWPTYLICGVVLLRIMLQYKTGKKYLAYAKAVEQAQGGDSDEPLKDRTLAMMYLDKAKFGCFLMSFALFMIFMAIGRIAGADYSSFLIFLPVLIISGCCMCCTTGAICFFRADPKDLDDIIGGVGSSVSRDGDDLEQWGSEEPSNDHPISSYGTYIPPDMPTTETYDNTPPIAAKGLGATAESLDSADID